MERQGAGLSQSYLEHLEHFNSELGPEETNQAAMLRALAYLPFAGNSPSPEGEVPGTPENEMGVDEYRRGLENAINAKGRKWLSI
jgi:hypothetical protein